MYFIPKGPLYHAVKGVVPSPEFSGSMLADTLKAFGLVQYTRVGSKLKINGINIDIPGLKAAEGGLQILDSILTEYTVTTTTTTMPTLSKEKECYRVWCEVARPRLSLSVCGGPCDARTFSELAYLECKKAWENANEENVELDPQECSKLNILSTTAVPSATTEHLSQPASHKKELEAMGISIQEQLAENNDNLAKIATTTVSSKSAAVAASPQSQAPIDTQQTLDEKDKTQTSDATAAVTAQTSSTPPTSTETSNNDPSNEPAHANQLSELGIETDVDAVDMAAATHNDSSSGEFLEF